jgi:ADP-ribosylglycohydrolase
MTLRDRVIGCFKGLATGDAIGKQTETLSRADVRCWYPAGVTGFHGEPGDVIPRYAGKRYEWRIGETTDDTEQTLAVTRALLRTGQAAHNAIGRELLQCKKSLHPGVSLWEFVQAGDPSRIASEGDGCGAAMRAAPVGMLYPSSRLDELARGAYECAIPTHGGSLAICAAAAVAGAVSAGLDGRSIGDVLTAAVEAATRAESFRTGSAGPSIAESIRRIHADLSTLGRPSVDELAARYFPNTPEHIVPLAINLAVLTGSAEQTALLAANIGGDADSVASISGAIAGAMNPASVNEGWWDVVKQANGDELIEFATAMAALRGNG